MTLREPEGRPRRPMGMIFSLRTLLLSLVVVLGLAACGDDDGASSDPAAPPTSASEDPSIALPRLTEAEADAWATERGLELRVVEVDGEPLAVTDDFREDRINVAIVDGVVTDVSGLG
ncbi:MAG: hypothetical protein AAFZ07_10940 [Actinomycetota bacterium]